MNVRSKTFLACSSLISALLFILIAGTPPVNASVIDNGSPDFSNGFEDGIRVLAEDFTLGDPTTLTSIRFWSIESGLSAFNGSVYWAIFSDDFGIPGSQVSGFAGSASAVRTFLGQGPNSIASNEFVYDLSLGSLTPLPPDRYWLILHNGSLAEDQFTGFFWALTGPNATLVSQQSALLNGAFGTTGWFTNNAQLAFQLDGDVAVPEPNAMLLVGSGLLLLWRAKAR